tara:strand:+ start:495 stop:1094 length:600 start_codon:yes stop_codon:yes gene_type:complete
MAVTMAYKNYFDDIIEGEPSEIVVGDFIQWKRSDLVDAYPTNLYSLNYVARIAAGGGDHEINIAATETTDYYLIQADSADTANYNPGDYHWQVEIVRTADSQRKVIDRGHFTVVPDLDVNASDPRSHSEIMLTKIESLLEGKADADVSSYSIAGRSLTKMTFQELVDARNYFSGKVFSEKAKLDAENHRSTSATIKVRF